jgi:hypothetical protein
MDMSLRSMTFRLLTLHVETITPWLLTAKNAAIGELEYYD